MIDFPPETPPGLIRWRDEIRPRRAGIVLNLRELECLDGHRVEVHGRIGAAGLQCHHQPHAGAPICGAFVFLVLFSPDETHQWRRRYWATDITLGEIEAIEREHLGPDEVVHRFGGIFPRGRRRVA